MASSLKVGLISLCVVGVGVGAYVVNLGLKKDRDVKNSTGTAVNNSASSSGGSNPGAPGSGPGAMAMSDTGTTAGNAASPPPVVPSATGGDSERSFRPHAPETTPVPPTPPSVNDIRSGAGNANTTTGGMGTAGSPNAAPTPTDSGSSSTGGNNTAGGVRGATASGNTGNTGATETHQPVVPTYTPPTTPPAANSERMGLTAPTPAGGAGTDAAKLTPPTTTTPEKEKATIHVVQKGETLTSIAVKYMGSARYATAIAKANPSIHPNRISVGAKLKIPAVQAPTTAPAGAGSSTVVNKNSTPPPPVDPTRAYTVKANDSWTGICRKLLGHDNWTVLYEYNRDRFPNNSRVLKPGMLIEIPPKDAVAPKDPTANKSTAVPKK